MVPLVLYACVGRNWHFMQLNDGNGLHQNKKAPLRKWSNFCLNGSFSFAYTHTQTERYHMPSEAIKPQYCQLGIVFVRAPCVCGGYLTRLAVWFGWLAWTQWSLCHTCVNSADKNCWTQEMANQNYQPHLFALLVWYTTWMSVVLGGRKNISVWWMWMVEPKSERRTKTVYSVTSSRSLISTCPTDVCVILSDLLCADIGIIRSVRRKSWFRNRKLGKCGCAFSWKPFSM